MSAFDTQPDNNNFLSPLGFRFIVKKLPLVNFYCQSASLPSVSLQETETPNPLVRIPLAGTKLTYAPLDIRFRVDKDMKNYLEIYNWMQGLGTPTDIKQYKQLNDDAAGARPTAGTGKMGNVMQGVFSDATLVVLTSAQNANIRISFVDSYPINISPLQFDVTGSDVAYIEADCTLNYRSFTVESV
jgi:hypothetical protein